MSQTLAHRGCLQETSGISGIRSSDSQGKKLAVLIRVDGSPGSSPLILWLFSRARSAQFLAAMLPKVATTVLHTSSRAAAAVHTQSHTLRNVFQLQSQSPAGSAKGGAGSSSSGRGNGASSGGPKYNAGSRFQKGYHVCDSSFCTIFFTLSCY